MAFDFTDKVIKDIEKYAGIGLSLFQIGYLIGCSKPTIERNMRTDPRINDAIQKGRAKAAATVSSACYGMAISGKHPAITMFWLKCRQNWSEIGRAENFEEEDYEI